MLRSQLLTLLIAVSTISYAQNVSELTGTWIIENVYFQSKKRFTVWPVEKHPFDTIQLNADHSFSIYCTQQNNTINPSIEENWNIYGQWSLNRKHLLFTNRTWTKSDERLNDMKYKILYVNNSLYIHVGSTPDRKSVYVRYTQ